jgi:hypothetical protein
MRERQEVKTMSQRLRANILRQGHMVRSKIARASTVVRYLEQVENLAEYEVIYWQSALPRRVTADGFLALCAAGTFDPASQSIRGGVDNVLRRLSS